jgi:histidinol-phosphatase (PHP family)
MGINYLKEELYTLVKRESKIFDFIQKSALDGMWYWDLEKKANEWLSPEFWETLGYDYKDKIHSPSAWQEIIFKEDLPEVIKNFNLHCKDPKHPFDQVVRYKHKNNSTVWIRCRGLAIRDREGKAIRMLGAHVDITEQKKVEEKIKKISSEYEKVFNSAQNAMFLIEVLGKNQFKYIRTNKYHQDKTGITLEMVRNKTPEELLGKETSQVVINHYQKCIDQKESITYEEELNLPGGKRIWLTTLTPNIENENYQFIVGSSVDITKRKTLEEKLLKSANYDLLTQLPNRRLFVEEAKQVILEHEREKRIFAFLFIDLDGFKKINDSYGHDIGDAVLRITAKRLSKVLRKSDLVARIGGDEFTVILRNIHSKASVKLIVEKIQGAIKEKMSIQGNSCKVGSSIGIAIYPEDGKNFDTLVKNSDEAMYTIKQNGKGGYSFI